MIRYCRIVSAVFCLLFSATAIAQQAGITGVVTDAASAPQVATVSLLSAKDSSWLRSVITDTGGVFALAGVDNGDYLLSTTSAGFSTAISPVSIKDNADQKITIVLAHDAMSLKEATVSGRKNFIEIGLGKVVVNVAASPTAIGTNVLDLMRRMPGVTVDQNGNISMQGKQGVLVLIDDRPTYLSGEQLANYLRTIVSDDVAQVELITQPPARYDAAGNAGVINIKRKKTKKEGLSGTATLSLGQGVYPIAIGSAFINYHKDKLNISLSGNELAATGFAAWTSTQRLMNPTTGATTSLINNHSTPVEHFSIASMRLAADYDLTDKVTMGISTKVGYHTNSMTDYVYATIFDAVNNKTTYNNIVSPDGFIRKDITTNAYFNYKFNNARSLNFNLDHLAYSNGSRQDITNIYYDELMQPLPGALLLRDHQPTLINVYSIKGDYTDTLSNGIKLEAGFKSALVTTDNDAQFSIFQNNAWIRDTARTNRFLYKENINALYISLDKQLGSRWETKIGVRAENTNAQGVQQVHDAEFNRSYISIFPTAYVTYKADSNNTLELNYGRRVDRPSYQSLNPFIYYSFQYSYSVGNPSLQPQYTNSVELKHSYKNMFITTLDLTSTTGVISDVLIPNSATGTVYTTQANIATNKLAYLSVLFNKAVCKWWSVNMSAGCYYANYTGLVNNSNITADGTGYFFNMDNQFGFGKGWKAQAQGYYMGRSIQSIISTALPVLYSGAGVTKKISAASNVTLSVEDPFYLNRYKEQNTLPGLQTNAAYKYNTQVVKIAYAYSFGNGRTRQHDTAAPEESRRIK